MNFETENTEFKSKFTEDLYKEVIAFANTEGGFIYVGIADTGEVVGLTNVDEEYTRITNGIRDAILPDVTMFVHYTIQDNQVVRIAVNEGTNKPYYLKGKGLKPSGVYVRQGTSSVQASYEQIRQMIKESDGDCFEEARSEKQNLTFECAKEFFTRYGVEFHEQKFRTLGLEHQGMFTNLALILSDQCPYSTKIAVFQDEECTIFRDHKEFSGSIFQQFEGVITYLGLCNKTKSTIRGVVRTDKIDYPEEAIREAFLNALIHRDYGFSGSILINVTDKKMEFISLGGLVKGLSVEDIRFGVSQPRNRNLAEVFHRLRLVESYGTGIRRIYKLYENQYCQPKIEITPGAFKISLPNMNESSDTLATMPLTGQMEEILSYLVKHGSSTEEELAQLLGVKATRLYTITRNMAEHNLIEVIGRGKNKTYRAK